MNNEKICKITALEVQEIITMLGNQFDSHDFILMFIKTYPYSYFKLLDRYTNVTMVDAQIALYLNHHAVELQIEKIGDVVSLNIMSNESGCSLWKKK